MARDTPSPYAKKGPYYTTLSPKDELAFKQWVKDNDIELTKDYDMRGFWKGVRAGDPEAVRSIDPNDQNMHFPDKWKTPYHDTFSNESIYAMPDAPHWEGDRLIDKSGKVLYDDKIANASSSRNEAMAKQEKKPKSDMARKGGRLASPEARMGVPNNMAGLIMQALLHPEKVAVAMAKNGVTPEQFISTVKEQTGGGAAATSPPTMPAPTNINVPFKGPAGVNIVQPGAPNAPAGVSAATPDRFVTAADIGKRLGDLIPQALTAPFKKPTELSDLVGGKAPPSDATMSNLVRQIFSDLTKTTPVPNAQPPGSWLPSLGTPPPAMKRQPQIDIPPLGGPGGPGNAATSAVAGPSSWPGLFYNTLAGMQELRKEAAAGALGPLGKVLTDRAFQGALPNIPPEQVQNMGVPFSAAPPPGGVGVGGNAVGSPMLPATIPLSAIAPPVPFPVPPPQAAAPPQAPPAAAPAATAPPAAQAPAALTPPPLVSHAGGVVPLAPTSTPLPEIDLRNVAPEIRQYITDNAPKYGLDPNGMMRMMMLESGGNPLAKNKSGAAGLFQFVPSTAKQYGLTNPLDWRANADAAFQLTTDNRDYLRKQLGREPTYAELYLAHQQGAGGAASLLSNPDKRAIDVVSPASILSNAGTRGQTAKGFTDYWANRFDTQRFSREQTPQQAQPEKTPPAPSSLISAFTKGVAGGAGAGIASAPGIASASPASSVLSDLASALQTASGGGDMFSAANLNLPKAPSPEVPRPGQYNPDPNAMRTMLMMLAPSLGIPQIPSLGQLMFGGGQSNG